MRVGPCGHLHPGGRAGRGRLVDGGLRASRPHPACRTTGSPSISRWPASFYAAIIWTAARLLPATRTPSRPAPVRLRVGAIVVVVLTLVQFFLGALVAGLRAGLIYNTWPLMDDRFIPRSADLFFASRLARLCRKRDDRPVQPSHGRLCASLVALVHLFDVWRTQDRWRKEGTLGWATAVTLARRVAQVPGPRRAHLDPSRADRPRAIASGRAHWSCSRSECCMPSG